MKQIFTNSLACNYSYFGKQKKKPFYNLISCKCVLGKFFEVIMKKHILFYILKIIENNNNNLIF